MTAFPHYKLVSIRPRNDFGEMHRLYEHAGINPKAVVQLRLFDLPLICVIVDHHGQPVWEPTLFLAEVAIRSRSITGDTVRTYGEALLPWLQYLKLRERTLSQSSEEILGQYRAQVSHMTVEQIRGKYASATVNLRIIVPVQFHMWGQRKGVAPSPLGEYLQSSAPTAQLRAWHLVGPNRRRSSMAIGTQRIIRRLPVSLSMEQVSRIMTTTPMPFRLMIRWCLATGIRRVEVANLRIQDLPSPEQIAQCSDGLFRMQLLRKGGREHTVHVPLRLLEETNWFVLSERREARPSAQNLVFVNRSGTQISRQSLTRAFRRSADNIGTKATLHHLRHTFAVHVLNILEQKHAEGETLNSIKTLQVLLGHASVVSTEIYLQAMQTSSVAVIEALDYLYGAEP